MKAVVAGAILAGGILVAPAPAAAAVVCQTLANTNPGTWYQVTCKKQWPWDDEMYYYAWVRCSNGLTYTGTEYYWDSSWSWGPWSKATCPSGTTRVQGSYHLDRV
jgi:hypothetical protein